MPENTSALRVLETFKANRSHVGLVIDEYGGFEGLITLDDILEAISGDIPLPHEEEEPDVVQREDGSWLLDGMLLLDELKELLKIRELPFDEDGSYQTLGGLVTAVLGRIPTAGDHFEWNGFRFEVADMDGRRVDKVIVAPTADTAPPGWRLESYLLKIWKRRSIALFSKAARCSTSPGSSHTPSHSGHLSTLTPLWSISIRSTPHLGQCMKWSSFSLFFSASAIFRFFSCSSFFFFSNSIRAKYSSSFSLGFCVTSVSFASIGVSY